MAAGSDKPGRVAAVMVAALWLSGALRAQVAAAVPPANATQVTAVAQGGTIRGKVLATAGAKAAGIPLPGVAVTATQTLTGKKYATATDVDGAYVMTIPKNGRYVVRAELAGFATVTQEVVLTGVEAQAATQAITIMPKATDFAMELASRAAADEKAAAASSTAALRGLQSLSLSGGGLDASNASAAGSAANGTAAPTLAGIDSSADSVAVSGQQGTTNGLANFSEDEIRSRVEDAIAQGRASGMIPQGVDTNGIVANVLGGMMGGRGPAGPGGGGGRGGRGGGGAFGSGGFRNFNPSQPHGSFFYQGGNSALNSAPWSPTLLPQPNPAAYQNRYGLTIGGSPYIPGLTKPNTKQFVFLNVAGQKNLTQFTAYGRVPTALEREGDFSASTLGVGNTATPVTLYDPTTGLPIAGNNLANAATPISPVAQALLAYYPAPNTPLNSVGDNYQTVSNGGNNNVTINARYVRTLGAAANTPIGRFGGGAGGRGNGNSTAPPTLHQNINVSYNYSHSASDNRNIFLPLGGATQSDGSSVNAGYTIGYGRLSNNASVTWNRLNGATRNYFTNSASDPSTAVGLTIPNSAGGFANPSFYNGLPTLSISNFQTLSNTSPSQTINQTISFSDFVSWRHKKHNMRYGLDVRRVHLDSIGGNDPLGALSFTGYATADAADKASGNAGSAGQSADGTSHSGDGFADFLLGLPQTTAIQADLYKTYLRENVYDWYVTDDWRLASSLTLNYGLRYEYFGPYSEKNGRLVNLTGIRQGLTTVDCVTPNGVSYAAPAGMVTCAAGSASLVNPDHAMYAPRVGFAYKLKNAGLTKDSVLRGGYGINYNTGQYAVFAKKLSGQEPFAVTQTNTLSSGCTTTTPTTTANMTLAKGFGCSTNDLIQNNWAVDKNYRLGMVQVYNLNLQRTFPLGIVFNVGYNGAKGSGLDVVGSPNGGPTGVTTASVSPFDYEESGAESRSNQLVVSLQKRQQKGIAVGATYTYGHAIDNASGVGGAVGTPVQNLFDLAAEEGNSSFDQRHNLTGNWVAELPFGPNRAFFNKGGLRSKLVDGFSLSGTFTFASGTYYTPQYSGSAAQALSGNVYTQRLNRVFTQSLKGPGTYKEWFNTAAFAAPVVNGVTTYGTASPGSIEGPGTVSVNASLARTVELGESRSFEVRATANNVFNTVQYSGISTTQNGGNGFGQVTSAASMRSLQVQARYRF